MRIPYPTMTGAAPKRKDTLFEREIVQSAHALGLRAQRAWSIDGHVRVRLARWTDIPKPVRPVDRADLTRVGTRGRATSTEPGDPLEMNASS